MEGTTIAEVTGTYYGNGCPGYSVDASSTPCSSRINATADGETQKIGTYYTFSAASSGSGSTVTTDNANTPDTFCPLGWQLPYSGTGGDYYNKSRSWAYLFNRYAIESNITGATVIRSYPLSYVNTGVYGGNTKKLYGMNYWTTHHSISVLDAGNVYRLSSVSDDVIPDSNVPKSGALSIRCIWKLASGCNYLVYVLK